MSSDATSSTPVKERNSDILNNKLLGLIVKQVSDKGLDWDIIANEMPVDKNGKATTVAAIKERWRRYKISNGLATVKSAEPGSSKKLAAKGKTSKRKAAGDGDDAGEEGDEEELETPTKKKGKTPVKANESDGDVSEQTPFKPKTKKPTSAKKTATTSAKKTTPAKPKAKPGKPVGAEELSEKDGDSKAKAENGETDASDGGMDLDTKQDDEEPVKSEKADSVKEEETHEMEV